MAEIGLVVKEKRATEIPMFKGKKINGNQAKLRNGTLIDII